MGQRLIITEEEKNSIRQMYEQPIKRDYVFEGVITVDGRYIIVHDEIFDNINQESYGNIWESIDKFKMIFTNVNIENTEYLNIRESILSLPILENENSLYNLRDYIIQEGVFGDVGSWVGDQFYNAATGITDFVKTSYNGVKKLGVAISQGQWSEILNLLKSGTKYILRKLKEALYSNIGMVVDAILVATMGGKVIQVIPWVLIAGLDLYQILWNDFPPEEQDLPTWAKWLFFGCDVLGAVGAGVMAKSSKKAATTLVKSAVENPTMVTKLLNKMPVLKNGINSMLSSVNKLPELIKSVISSIGKKSPAIAKFLTSVLSRISSAIKSFIDSMSTLLGKKVGKATVKGTGKEVMKTSSILYGFDKAFGTEEVDPELMNIAKDYGYL